MMLLLRNLAFAVIFYVGSLVATTLVLVTATFGGSAVRRQAMRWARFHHWCTRHLLGIETRVEGMIPRGAVLVAAKHQSMFETLELLRLLDEPAIVLKQELADLPLWGRVARLYGVIPVDREGSAKALRAMLTAARTAKAEGRSILIFPEGTRVPVGQTPPLRAGFAGLYRMVSVPVVAVALDSGRLWPRRGLKRPGVVTLRFGAATPPGQPRSAIEAMVHAGINVLENSTLPPETTRQA
jgi:1-acyl-sn-glycerol-3-phosphate acyltransferase